jgi:hypothetical protein
VLQDLYASVQQGVTVSELQSSVVQVLEALDDQMIHDIRAGKGDTKRLADELIPVVYWAGAKALDTDIVRFPLDDGPIDCFALRDGEIFHRIQITITQGEARHHTAGLLNKRIPAPGFVNLVDGGDQEEAKAVKARNRTMFVSSQPLAILEQSVVRSLEKKTDPKGADILLIAAQLHSLPQDTWQSAVPKLTLHAQNSKFVEIFVVGSGRKAPLCLQIK